MNTRSILKQSNTHLPMCVHFQFPTSWKSRKTEVVEGAVEVIRQPHYSQARPSPKGKPEPFYPF